VTDIGLQMHNKKKGINKTKRVCDYCLSKMRAKNDQQKKSQTGKEKTTQAAGCR
jgi:hypothetical protein